MIKGGGINGTKFIVTERGGKEKLEELILEPLVRYINDRAGRKIVKVREQNESSFIERNQKRNIKTVICN